MCDISKPRLLKLKYSVTKDTMNLFILGNKVENYMIRLYKYLKEGHELK